MFVFIVFCGNFSFLFLTSDSYSGFLIGVAGMYEIKEWSSIKSDFSRFLILGNGASISIDNKFRYDSLLEKAYEKEFISRKGKALFDSFKTHDFESILRMLWYSCRVNEALGIEENITRESYDETRNALIKVVRDIHPLHENVSKYFECASSFLRGFDVIFSLNYDLLLYWIMLYSNNCHRSHAFKDCFDGQEFSDKWRKYREPIYGQKKTTLVFYPHGNLILVKKDEVEGKIISRVDGKYLLDEILDKWEREDCIPQFISEGGVDAKT
ncbi:DUF4917 family protein [Dickeya zeae]|uniref:DUF4917 family protein n=1 Tax=Dickeya zeae TaxID=204042 RepID=UPI0003A67AF3|nr:DUF4917 family protein [Dickeya zeae]